MEALQNAYFSALPFDKAGRRRFGVIVDHAGYVHEVAADESRDDADETQEAAGGRAAAGICCLGRHGGITQGQLDHQIQRS